MSGHESRVPDAARSRLRAAVEAVDGAVSRLTPAVLGEDTSSGGLLTSWRALVDLLALGPEPKTRECPVCGGFGMHDATVCGYCWTKLAPLASSGAAEPAVRDGPRP